MMGSKEKFKFRRIKFLIKMNRIIGYVGKDNEAIKKTIYCLVKLECRGYDSVGIPYVSNNEVIINKTKSRIKNQKDKFNMDL